MLAETGNTVMHELPVGECQWALYAVLRDGGADMTARNHKGHTPLLCAAAAGDLRLVRLMLLDGASASDTGIDGETPMHAAAATDDSHVSPALIQCLAEHGGQADVEDAKGMTPVDIARSRGPEGRPIEVCKPPSYSLPTSELHTASKPFCTCEFHTSVVLVLLVTNST